MKYNPEIHHRRSIRLKGYDYSLPGAYFITICTQNRVCLLGEIRNGQMSLRDAGYMITKWFHELENKFPDIKCDEFICMPNHVHFILINVGADLRVCPNKTGEHTSGEHTLGEHTLGEHRGSPLHRVIQWFKTMTTNEYIRNVKYNNWQRFDKKFWQRNYYEHIIRNETDFNRIRKYIADNPSHWECDEHHYGS